MRLHADSQHAKGHCKLLWFMGLRAGSDSDYFDYVKAALISAKHMAPSLVPYLIYSGPACAMTAWFEMHGGHVLFHDLSFFKDLREADKGDVSGAYLRLDVPAVVRTLSLDSDIDPNIVLYTDVDVIFLKDITACNIEAPKLFSIGAEHQRGTKANTGVMLLNVKAFEPYVPKIVKYAMAKNYEFSGHNQGLLLDYFPQDNISQLPDEFNWKGYWGRPEGSDPFIFHWHGPKPLRGAPCLLRQAVHGSSMSPAKLAEVCKPTPEVYAILFLKSPDNGAYYNEALQLYEKFLQEGTQKG